MIRFVKAYSPQAMLRLRERYSFCVHTRLWNSHADTNPLLVLPLIYVSSGVETAACIAVDLPQTLVYLILKA